MTQDAARIFDFLTGAEADYMDGVIDKHRETIWAKPLIAEIDASGGLRSENMAKLFELRFGNALSEAGVQPRYEVPGEAASKIDFGFASEGKEFLVEMMRLEETDAVRKATIVKEIEGGVVMAERHLHSDAGDPKQTPEGETLKAVQRICKKHEKDGRPHKFPSPAGATHVLLVDMRAFKHGGDKADRAHIALGGKFVPQPFRHYFEGKLITGVFDSETNQKGAAEARERLHFIGFVNEKAYGDGTFGPSIQFIANNNLFKSAEDAQEALAGWPLGVPEILNAPFGATSANVAKLAKAMSAITVAEGADLSRLLKDRWGLSS
ncbi:hypothetical protein EDE08_10399 [Bradyrhizobium sp. R2.2-H]|jgi:hypothetical protein|uniref:hypothetical protein n=1 Tax=unclassified Bradyrhizobium TaxID=2631580 RepID=UPI0010496FDD|nr:MULTISPECIES: hypothetical protein [unclassified Bradyrhizobium]TCU74884.1 hypothetical protein EDE10_10398 [Bradyrhizobium sp. Y-H1]TCU77652.1 hypothetical protein EDE08_10399 [Bradyrhizobium sp. R2.2-H]